MSNVMEYKGYRAKIEYSAEDKTFIGNVLGINDVLAFDGETISQLEDMFHDNIDDYLVMCKEFGTEGTTMKLIDANALMEFAKNDVTHTVGINDIARFPTVEAVPVVHEPWKYFHKQNCAVCTNCSFKRDLDINFGKAVSCPNCGAMGYRAKIEYSAEDKK